MKKEKIGNWNYWKHFIVSGTLMLIDINDEDVQNVKKRDIIKLRFYWTSPLAADTAMKIHGGNYLKGDWERLEPIPKQKLVQAWTGNKVKII